MRQLRAVDVAPSQLWYLLTSTRVYATHYHPVLQVEVCTIVINIVLVPAGMIGMYYTII